MLSSFRSSTQSLYTCHSFCLEWTPGGPVFVLLVEIYLALELDHVVQRLSLLNQWYTILLAIRSQLTSLFLKMSPWPEVPMARFQLSALVLLSLRLWIINYVCNYLHSINICWLNILVCSGYHEKYHRLGSLNNRHLLSHIQEARNLRPRCGQGWFFRRPLSLACSPSSPYDLTCSLCACLHSDLWFL